MKRHQPIGSRCPPDGISPPGPPGGRFKRQRGIFHDDSFPSFTQRAAPRDGPLFRSLSGNLSFASAQRLMRDTARALPGAVLDRRCLHMGDVDLRHEIAGIAINSGRSGLIEAAGNISLTKPHQAGAAAPRDRDTDSQACCHHVRTQVVSRPTSRPGSRIRHLRAEGRDRCRERAISPAERFRW